MTTQTIPPMVDSDKRRRQRHRTAAEQKALVKAIQLPSNWKRVSHFFTIYEVMAATHLSEGAIRKKVKAGTFPQPFPAARNRYLWDSVEVARWVEGSRPTSIYSLPNHWEDEDCFLDLKEVMLITQCSANEILAMIDEGSFPSSKQLAPGCFVWISTEIAEWKNKRDKEVRHAA